MIMFPGCPCCGAPISDCPAESITVTLADLPNENRVDTSGSNSIYYAGDNYMTSNEGDFTLTKTTEYEESVSGSGGVRHVCLYDYEDALSIGSPALKIRVFLYNYYNASTPFWRVLVEVDADGGRLTWQKSTTASNPLPTTLTNGDVVTNNSAEWVFSLYYYVPSPWTLQSTMSVTVQAVTGGSVGQCQTPTCTSWFPATPGTCNQIMGVTNGTNRPAYCGTNPTIYSVAPDSSAPNNTLTFVNAGTDMLDLTLDDWTGNLGSSGTRTISFGGLTHSLGWGGADCVDLLMRVDTDNLAVAFCGTQNGYLPVTRHGWVGAFNVTLTDDFTASGGQVYNYQCTALASVTLSRRYYTSYVNTSAAPSRRIELLLSLYHYEGVEPTGNYLTEILNTRVALSSKGTIGEDAYTYGNFPTFTRADSNNPVVLCPFDLYGATWTNTPFTVAQG